MNNNIEQVGGGGGGGVMLNTNADRSMSDSQVFGAPPSGTLLPNITFEKSYKYDILKKKFDISMAAKDFEIENLMREVQKV